MLEAYVKWKMFFLGNFLWSWDLADDNGSRSHFLRSHRHPHGIKFYPFTHRYFLFFHTSQNSYIKNVWNIFVRALETCRKSSFGWLCWANVILPTIYVYCVLLHTHTDILNLISLKNVTWHLTFRFITHSYKYLESDYRLYHVVFARISCPLLKLA